MAQTALNQLWICSKEKAHAFQFLDIPDFLALGGGHLLHSAGQGQMGLSACGQPVLLHGMEA
jgi:hypothetical protein